MTKKIREFRSMFRDSPLVGTFIVLTAAYCAGAILFLLASAVLASWWVALIAVAVALAIWGLYRWFKGAEECCE